MCYPEIEESLPNRMAEKCDNSRLEKANRILSGKGRVLSLAVGLLLQKIRLDYLQGTLKENWSGTIDELVQELGAPSQIRYRMGENGKPYYADLPVFFSVSHSEGFVFAAADGKEVGVDIQKKRGNAICGIAKRFYAPEELSRAECLEEQERIQFLYRLWTRKEAYGKFTGEGVAPYLKQPVESLRGVRFFEVPAPEGYEISVCTPYTEECEGKENG